MATDSEKVKKYDELLGLLKDRVALEQHLRAGGQPPDAIAFVRADAYAAVVYMILGPDTLPDINMSRYRPH